MNKYVSPIIEISEFKGEDILTASTAISADLQQWANENGNAVTAQVDYDSLYTYYN
ncbi:MAG: hypothetical protein IJT23_08265 [Clostridia bacterium]|nr:hypothetical protein [Clostridia bacterium]